MSDETTFLDFTEYVAERARGFIGRGWLFNDLNVWVADSDGPRVFLIIGEPGSGKSALAAQLVQYASGNTAPSEDCPALAKGFVHAIHFCQAEDPLTVDPTVFARSLTLQLSERFPALREAVLARSVGPVFNITQTTGPVADGGSVTAMQVCTLRIGDLDPRIAFNRLVVEPLRIWFSKDDRDPVIVLVDGLDEAPVYDKGIGIAQLLANLEAFPRGVRFIFMSAPVRVAMDLAKQPATLVTSLTSGTGLKNSLDDIHEYVIREIASHLDISLRMAKGISASDIASAVQNKSEGNFLYVRCLLEMLEKQTEPITWELLAAFPIGLDRLYWQHLQHLVGNNTRDWEEKLAPVLGTLAVARVPLTEVQIANYTKQKTEQVRQTLSDLPYLDVDTSQPYSKRLYALFHRSFAWFLLDGDRSETFWCNPLTSHQRIIDFCRGDVWEKVDWDACDDYALRYLVYHIQRTLSLIEQPADQEKLAQALYAIVLSPAYRHTQFLRLQDKPPVETEVAPGSRYQKLMGLAARGMLAFFGLGDGGTSTVIGTVVVRQQSRVIFNEKGIQAAAVSMVGVSEPPGLDFTRLHLRTALELALERGDRVQTLAILRVFQSGGRPRCQPPRCFRPWTAAI